MAVGPISLKDKRRNAALLNIRKAENVTKEVKKLYSAIFLDRIEHI